MDPSDPRMLQPSSALGDNVLALHGEVAVADALIASAQLVAAEARARLAAARALLDAEAELAGSAFNLPMSCLERIFRAVPYETRLRCREVSRSWRALLGQRHLWTTPSGHVSIRSAPTPSDALLAAITARAGASCTKLSLSTRNRYRFANVLVVVAGLRNLTALHLRYTGARGDGDLEYVTLSQLKEMLNAAPQIKELECNLVTCMPNQVMALLDAPPAGTTQLKIGCLQLARQTHGLPNLTVAQIAAALLAKQKKAIHSIHWHHPINVPADFDALMDAANKLQLHTLHCHHCLLLPAMIPPLTRLLTDNIVLHTLKLSWAVLPHQPLPSDAALTALAAALRASRLRSLQLTHMHLWTAPAVGTELLGSLEGHRTLSSFTANHNPAGPGAASAAAGKALAQLLDTSPHLTKLSISQCDLNDEWAAPLFAAVGRSATLKELHMVGHSISAECARSCVLPAVKANTSLRLLEIYNDSDGAVNRSLANAEGMVRSRPAV